MAGKFSVDGVPVLETEIIGDYLNVRFAGSSGWITGVGEGHAPIIRMLSDIGVRDVMMNGRVTCSRTEYENLKRSAILGNPSAQSLLSRVDLVTDYAAKAI